MANLAQTEATTLLDSLFRQVAYTVPPAVYVALATSTPTSTAAGTEVSGGSYARQALTMAAASAGANASNAILTYTNMPAAVVTSVDLWSAVTGTARRLWYGALTASKTTASGDTLSFASGAITAALA